MLYLIIHPFYHSAIFHRKFHPFQVTGAPSDGDLPFKYRLKAGNTNYDGETTISVINGDRTPVSISDTKH